MPVPFFWSVGRFFHSRGAGFASQRGSHSRPFDQLILERSSSILSPLILKDQLELLFLFQDFGLQSNLVADT